MTKLVSDLVLLQHLMLFIFIYFAIFFHKYCRCPVQSGNCSDYWSCTICSLDVLLSLNQWYQRTPGLIVGSDYVL